MLALRYPPTMAMWTRAAPIGMALWLVVGGCGSSQSDSDAAETGGDAAGTTTSGAGGSAQQVQGSGTGGGTTTRTTGGGAGGAPSGAATPGAGGTGAGGTGASTTGAGGTAGGPVDEVCAGLACGADCQLCSSGAGGACESGHCTAEGECSTAPVGCDPTSEAPDEACAGKGCGAPCSTCALDDVDCLAAGQAQVCNALGQCQQAPVTCSVTRPFCSATAFEDTGDGCVEESFVWDGNQCTSVTHCGCASGDCDRLYPDAESCRMAHAACLPSFCAIQDAIEAAPAYGECPQPAGYAFDGVLCHGLCECQGDDCADIESTEDACKERFATCLERTPECIDGHFPVEAAQPGYLASYPEYGFSVEGFDQLYDEATRQVAVFPEWTRAEWVGWEDPAEPANCFPFAPRYEVDCPSARPLVLQVEDQVFRILVTLHWQSWIAETVTPSEVEVRIVAHPSGSLILQIRDVATQLPVVMVVRSETDASGVDAPWEFSPFTFSAGEALCQTPADECNWTFAARGLAIETPEVHWTLAPFDRADLGARNVHYAALHGYIFRQEYVASEACSDRFVPRQNFALLQLGPTTE